MGFSGLGATVGPTRTVEVFRTKMPWFCGTTSANLCSALPCWKRKSRNRPGCHELRFLHGPASFRIETSRIFFLSFRRSNFVGESPPAWGGSFANAAATRGGASLGRRVLCQTHRNLQLLTKSLDFFYPSAVRSPRRGAPYPPSTSGLVRILTSTPSKNLGRCGLPGANDSPRPKRGKVFNDFLSFGQARRSNAFLSCYPFSTKKLKI